MNYLHFFNHGNHLSLLIIVQTRKSVDFNPNLFGETETLELPFSGFQ